MRCIIHIMSIEGEPSKVVPRALRELADHVEQGAVIDFTLPLQVEVARAPPRPSLSPAQQRLLNAIVFLQERDGIVPSRRELLAYLGLKSLNAVHETLLGLQTKGYVAFEATKARSLRIL